MKKFKERVREKTSRRVSQSMDARISKLNEYLVGWLGYFHIADMKSHLKRMDSWIRRRLRMCLWKQWKKVKTRIRKLRSLGLPNEEAIKLGNTRKGYWRIASCQQIHITLNNKYWKEQCLISLTKTYSKYR